MNFEKLSRDRLLAMAEAARDAVECQRVLAKTGGNIVGELLPRDEPFYQFDHCPPGDIYDQETHSQYYYYAHREAEHGHFHTFVREKSMPAGVRPVEQSTVAYITERDDRLFHLVAIAMDRQGQPIGLFTVNRWVTTENWYPADQVIAILDRFQVDHARPSWPANRWVTAMLRLFHPQIVDRLHARDRAVADWRRRHPEVDVFEDRRLEQTSAAEISLADQIEAVQSALDARG